ncbi:MAG: RIP metalloprotease RseP [Kiritimatiellae bacterium]|nr:RIP metalloprotease RseP [Kiritimatiellia bacterium]MDD5521384.1 RIP metalloprotease RseP [Kiritimatiellia bacterium]
MIVEGINSIYIGPILIFLLGMTIFVHEFGHYIAARWLGFVVEVFSIGFGPAIWKRKYNGIVYKIGWIPFGGYVALPQLDPTGMSTIQTGAEDQKKDDQKKDGEELQKKYPAIAPWKKIIVALAGAAGNIILAVIIAWMVYLIGMPAGPAERSPVIGHVKKDCKAYQLGLRTGDEIISVNGITAKNWREFVMEAALHNEVVVCAKSITDRTEKTLTVPTEKGLFGEQTVAGVRGLGLCSILSVEPGMSADKAGLKSGDVIIGFASGPVFSMEHFVDLINEYKDQDVPIKVSRVIAGKRVVQLMKVRPVYDESTSRVRIGITWNMVAIDVDTVIKPLPSEQLREHATAVFRFLKAIATPKQAKAAASGVGGPVAIMISYWYIVKASIMLAIWFTGLLNINLAILNLLPIPVLDGGHIMFSLWEVITRRPVSPKIVNVLVNVFVIMFLAFAVFISIRDMDRMTPARKMMKSMMSRSKGDNLETNSTKTTVQPVKSGTNSEK